MARVEKNSCRLIQPQDSIFFYSTSSYSKNDLNHVCHCTSSLSLCSPMLFAGFLFSISLAVLHSLDAVADSGLAALPEVVRTNVRTCMPSCLPEAASFLPDPSLFFSHIPYSQVIVQNQRKSFLLSFFLSLSRKEGLRKPTIYLYVMSVPTIRHRLVNLYHFENRCFLSQPSLYMIQELALFLIPFVR